MRKLHRITAFLLLPLFCASMTGCSEAAEIVTDLLDALNAESTELTAPLQQETVQVTMPETTAPETTEPETTAPATTAKAVTEPPVQEELQYATPAMLDIYAYFAAMETAEMPAAIRNADWAEVPYFTDTDQLRLYLESQLQECREEIPVIILPGCRLLELEEYFNAFGLLYTQNEMTQLTKDGAKLKFAVYSVEYAAGTLCMYAERTGDLSKLDAQDLAAYQEAKRFLAEELDTDADPVTQLRQIHDYICDRTVYLTLDLDGAGRESFRMATGVLLDGYANCMGYSDAFYLLASMAGFTVLKDTNEDHMWNLVALEDGLHLMDVTWDDDSLLLPDGTLQNFYRFFNAGMDIVENDYELEPDCPTWGIIGSCETHRIPEAYAEWEIEVAE